MLYASNTDSNTISVIDGNNPNNIKNVKVGLNPTDLAVNPKTNKIYVASTGSNTVSVIDGKTDNVLHSVPVGFSPTDLAVNPNTNKIYVASTGSNTVSAIDGVNLNNIKNVKVGLNPTDLAVNPNTNKIYVANTGSNSISVIAGNNLKNIKNMTSPIDQSTTLTVDPRTNQIYVLSSLRNQFFIINGTTDNIVRHIIQQSTLTIFNGGPTIMSIDPNNGNIYAANQYFGTISITDEQNFPGLMAKVNIGGLPSDIAIDADTNLAYIVNKDYNTVTVLKTR